MNNNINDLDIPCTSCQMCASVCPHNAISIRLNNYGFYEPNINNDLCINCGICKKICIKYDKLVKSDNNYDVYAFKHTSKNVLKNVSSGGAAFTLAKLASDNDYLIAGTIYDCKQNNAKMKISNNANDFVGSKYIQTYVDNIYKKLLNDVTQKYIVFGTPCQIYSLNKAANYRGIRDNYILVDFFCHGCPSMFLWNKYISEYKKTKGHEKIKKVEFRSKSKSWHEFCISINDTCQKNSDAFYNLFFSDIILNEACYNCNIRSTLNYADIRIGDFWGKMYDGDADGVSAVIPISDKGKNFINFLPKKCIISKHNFDDIVKYQAFNIHYPYNKELRLKLINILKTKYSIKKALNIYYSNVSAKQNLKRFFKKISLVMPFKVRAFIRKKLH